MECCEDDAVKRRLELLAGVAASHGESSLRLLVDALGDCSWDVRARAIEYLAEYSGAKVSEAMARGLHDSDEMVRIAAIEVVGNLQLKEHRERLLFLLTEDPDVLVRAAAAYSLGQLGGAGAELKSALVSEGDEAVKLRLLCALGMSGHDEAYQMALGYLGAQDYRTRCAAINLLSEHLPKGHLTALKEGMVGLVLKDPSRAVRDTARFALMDL